MFPNYVSMDPSKYPLSQDDVNGIQSIYGEQHHKSEQTWTEQKPFQEGSWENHFLKYYHEENIPLGKILL